MATRVHRTKRRVAETVLETVDTRGATPPVVMVRPLIVYWFITSFCPNECEHCVAAEIRDRSDEVGRDGLFRLADRLIEAGIPWIALTGGEPLARPELPELVAHLRDADVACFLTTSGAGLSRESLSTLREAGLARILVSLDGPPQVQDSFRGPGSHETSMTALEILRGGGVPYGISTTVHAGNVDALEYVRNMARDSGSSQLFVNEYVPQCAEDHGAMRSLDAPQRDQLYRDLHRLRTEDSFSPWAGQYKFQIVSPLATAWVSEEEARLRGRPPRAGWLQRLQQSFTLGCGAGTLIAALLPDGQLTPCYGWHLPLGNLLDTPLAELWAGPELERIRREYHRRCAGCAYTITCGGCPGRRQGLGEDLHEADPACPVAAGLPVD